jgi:hypothetical protein
MKERWRWRSSSCGVVVVVVVVVVLVVVEKGLGGQSEAARLIGVLVRVWSGLAGLGFWFGLGKRRAARLDQ